METKMKIFLFFFLSLSQVYRPRPFNGAAITSGKFENLAKFLDYTEGERERERDLSPFSATLIATILFDQSVVTPSA